MCFDRKYRVLFWKLTVAVKLVYFTSDVQNKIRKWHQKKTTFSYLVTFTQIPWKHNRLSQMEEKTGEGFSLRMLKDVASNTNTQAKS